MKTSLTLLVLLLSGVLNNIMAQGLEEQAQSAAKTLQQEVTVEVDSASNWKLSGISGINASQTSLVNWSAGGENTIAGNFYLNTSLDYAKGKWAWDNDLMFDYGLIYSDENDWRKSSDKISFTSKLGYQINTKWFYSLLVDYNSQFAKGYNYPNTNTYLSNFMAPGYSNVAVGINYKPNADYSLFLSPATTRFLFVLDDSLSSVGAYGIDPGKNVKVEAGVLFKGSMKKTIMKNVDLISKLDMFTPYTEDFGNIDINWEMMFSFKINEILSATLNTTLRYYDREHYINSRGENKGPKVQFREMLGLGVAYRF